MGCMGDAVMVVEEGVVVDGGGVDDCADPGGELQEVALHQPQPQGEGGVVLAADQQHHQRHRLVV